MLAKHINYICQSFARLYKDRQYSRISSKVVVWTALNWRISKWEDISFQCDKLASSMGGAVSRPWDDCVNRLLTRGLLVSGCGETEYDALYDLLSSLGIIPTSGSALVRGCLLYTS